MIPRDPSLSLLRCPVAILTVVVGGAVLAGPIEDLKPGHWYEVKGATIRSVAPQPKPAGVEDVSAVVRAASGGAYDSKRERMMVWGGGGTNSYSGNEVYVFDVNALKWQRLLGPSRDTGGYVQTSYYPDGQPRARHTYDYIEYVPPPVDRFCSFGAVTMYGNGNIRAGNVDCLNLDTLKWERRANALSYGIGALSAFDPVTRHVWVHGVGISGFLTEYDPVHDKWMARGRPRIEGGFLQYEMTADIDPKRRLFVAAGNGRVYVWDLKQEGLIRGTEISTTGDVGFLFAISPGFVYDPVIDKFVAWQGGADVYILDIDKRVWKKQPPAPTNTVVPPPGIKRGTYGRFRYMPSKNAYILVNGVDEPVYIYRLSANPSAKSP